MLLIMSVPVNNGTIGTPRFTLRTLDLGRGDLGNSRRNRALEVPLEMKGPEDLGWL